MRRSRKAGIAFGLGLSLTLVLGGCDGSDSSPTAVASTFGGSEQPVALDEGLIFVAPDWSSVNLSTTTSVLDEAPDPADRPALAETGELEDEQARPLQQIFDPETRVGFEPGYAWALGSHRYIGNLGSVTTTAHATYNDMDLGSYTGTRQKYLPFLADWGLVKHIWQQSKIYTDHECGVSVQGYSDHRAWWQFYQAKSAPEWGLARRSSQSGWARQPACANSGTSQVTTGEESAQGTVCYYLITYDLDTGEIVNAEFLFCNSTGGEETLL
jgi:hypothetical protein